MLSSCAERSRTSSRSRSSARSPVRALTRNRAPEQTRARKRDSALSRKRGALSDSGSDSDVTIVGRLSKRRDSQRSRRHSPTSELGSPSRSFEASADLVPKLWERDPLDTHQTIGGAVKTPKYHLPRWNGSVITYPDFIRAFRDFVHLRSDIFVPQKIQILESCLPKLSLIHI